MRAVSANPWASRRLPVRSAPGRGLHVVQPIVHGLPVGTGALSDADPTGDFSSGPVLYRPTVKVGDSCACDCDCGVVLSFTIAGIGGPTFCGLMNRSWALSHSITPPPGLGSLPNITFGWDASGLCWWSDTQSVSGNDGGFNVDFFRAITQFNGNDPLTILLQYHRFETTGGSPIDQWANYLSYQIAASGLVCSGSSVWTRFTAGLAGCTPKPLTITVTAT